MQQRLKFKVFSVNNINTIYLSYVKYISNAYTCYLKNHKEEISTFIGSYLQKKYKQEVFFLQMYPFCDPKYFIPLAAEFGGHHCVSKFLHCFIFKINFCTILLIIENTYKKYVPRIEVCTKICFIIQMVQTLLLKQM